MAKTTLGKILKTPLGRKGYQEVVINLNDKKDVDSIDRGAGSGCILSEVTIIKNGKSTKGWFSVVMRNNKACLEIETNGKHRDSPSIRKRIKMVPWREIGEGI